MMNSSGFDSIKLSICIATFNRADKIGETLDSILLQLNHDVELVIVDGASSDTTGSVVKSYCDQNTSLRYFREPMNSGVDADFDKAVSYARGKYCWLMTDDDLLVPDAIKIVLEEIANNPSLIVVNSEVCNIDFTRVFQNSRIGLNEDMNFARVDDSFLTVTGDALSFIASVIIRRDVWLARERKPYYGSLFIHVGVIFQLPPLENIRVVSKPLISIRYGNAMWTSRSFEIWMIKWPGLVWEFSGFSEQAKRAVCHRQPWRNPIELLKHRAKGSYSMDEYHKYIRNRASRFGRLGAAAIALIPAALANFIAVAFVITINRKARLGLDDLLGSPHANPASRLLARLFPLSEPIR